MYCNYNCNNDNMNNCGGNIVNPGFNRARMAGCPQPMQPQARVRYYNNTSNVNGANCAVVNRNYYNNLYNRYNRYNITDCNIVKDYVKDYNVYHYDTKTIDNGCQYLGSVDMFANNDGSGYSYCDGCNNCNFTPVNSCGNSYDCCNCCCCCNCCQCKPESDTNICC